MDASINREDPSVLVPRSLGSSSDETVVLVKLASTNDKAEHGGTMIHTSGGATVERDFCLPESLMAHRDHCGYTEEPEASTVALSPIEFGCENNVSETSEYVRTSTRVVEHKKHAATHVEIEVVNDTSTIKEENGAPGDFDESIQKPFPGDPTSDMEDEELRKYWIRTLISCTSTGEVVEEIVRILKQQNTHDMFCPVCGSCVTKRVVLRKRERAPIPGPSPPAYGCLACCSLFIQRVTGILTADSGSERFTCLPFFFPPYPWGKKVIPDSAAPLVDDKESISIPRLVSAVFPQYSWDSVPLPVDDKESISIPRLVSAAFPQYPWDPLKEPFLGKPWKATDNNVIHSRHSSWLLSIFKAKQQNEQPPLPSLPADGTQGPVEQPIGAQPWPSLPTDGTREFEDPLKEPFLGKPREAMDNSYIRSQHSSWFISIFKGKQRNEQPRLSALPANDPQGPVEQPIRPQPRPAPPVDGTQELEVLLKGPSLGKPLKPIDKIDIHSRPSSWLLSIWKGKRQDEQPPLSSLPADGTQGLDPLKEPSLGKPSKPTDKNDIHLQPSSWPPTLKGKQQNEQPPLSLLPADGTQGPVELPIGPQPWPSPPSDGTKIIEVDQRIGIHILPSQPADGTQESEVEQRIGVEILPSQPADGTQELEVEQRIGIQILPSQPADGTQESEGWEILKSIVHGGLEVSVASLGVVSSAAGGEATTRTVVFMAVATLLSGLIAFYNHVVDLFRNGGTVYEQTVGKTFWLHGTIAVISYFMFGLLAPITYAFTFRDTDNVDFKFAATCGVSAVSIFLLSLGKARVSQRPYIETVLAYISSGVVSSVVGYLAGEHIAKLLEKWGFKDRKSSNDG